MFLSNSCISADSITTNVRSMSSTTAATPKKYRNHYTRSWNEYQQLAPSHLHSIEHYNKECEEHAKLYDEDVMFLRENITKITGWYWCTGWSPQNCAESDGYVDVRTGKKYTLHGDNSFFKEIK